MSDHLHEIGDVVEVTITNIVNFGAFASLDNDECGLIHISEINDSFIKDINAYFEVGQVMKAKIIDFGDKPHTYQLSLKRLTSRRPRQNIGANKKPLSRKQLNVLRVEKIGFEKTAEVLDEQIKAEYERINKKNG